ncbi:hypothetical protein JTB14_020767 [Gonioctena quinquepunctata]|nr:hypothetical protein JTB14_020767 [Gonioctena quinquepunctata]
MGAVALTTPPKHFYPPKQLPCGDSLFPMIKASELIQEKTLEVEADFAPLLKLKMISQLQVPPPWQIHLMWRHHRGMMFSREKLLPAAAPELPDAAVIPPLERPGSPLSTFSTELEFTGRNERRAPEFHGIFLNAFLDEATEFRGNKMEFSREKYDLTDAKHCEELRNLLLEQESDNENPRVDIDDENSDTDASVCVEEREEKSDSEQSDFFASGEDVEENATYSIAVQKRRNVVVKEWKWQKFPLSQRRRKPAQHLLGVIGDAKQANGIT